MRVAECGMENAKKGTFTIRNLQSEICNWNEEVFKKWL
jgi:hypothetical protein